MRIGALASSTVAVLALLAGTAGVAQQAGSSGSQSGATQPGAQSQPQSAPPSPAQQTNPGGNQPGAETSPPPATSGQEPAGQDTGLQPAGPPANDDKGMFVFKKQVEEVVLHATVTDEQRRPAAHLDQSAFTVFDNGQAQTITSFHRVDVPLAMGIVIDNSGSMRPKREKVNQAVLNLIRASNPQDQIFVVNFSDKYYLDQDYTSDINLLQRALNRTTTKGSTALYDAVVASAEHLQKNSLQKKVLLVITDGEDNMSTETLEEAMHHLQGKDSPVVYAIGLMGFGQPAGRQALQKIADATGGSAFFPDNREAVGDVTLNLAHDLRRQYTLAYKPVKQTPNGAYHPVVVEARAPGYGKLTVRTRTGYYTGEEVR